MPLDNPKGGIGYAVEFQSSALPWVTSSISLTAPERFDFPKITRFITVYNRSTTSTDVLAIGFTRNGVSASGSTNNRFLLNGNQQVTFEVRVKELYLMSHVGTPPYSIFAGLTNIDSTHMPVLTGSNWTGVG